MEKIRNDTGHSREISDTYTKEYLRHKYNLHSDVSPIRRILQ